MVNPAREAIESLYRGRCSIVEQQEVINPNGSTGFEDVVVLKDQPCRLSIKMIQVATNSDTATTISKEVKLILAPEIVIKPGSRITVTQNGQTAEYKSSGIPAVRSNHQEVVLKSIERWA